MYQTANLVLTQYHNTAVGRPAIIYGCGPSLNTFDIAKLPLSPKRPPVNIAMKLAILANNVPKPDFILFGDKNLKSQLYEHLLPSLDSVKLGLIYQEEGEITIKTYDEEFCEKVGAKPLHISYRDGFQKQIDQKWLYRCSTLFPCLQLALFIGSNPIFVVGADFSDHTGFIDVPGAAKRLKPFKTKMPGHLRRFMEFKNEHYPKVKVIRVNPPKTRTMIFDDELYI